MLSPFCVAHQLSPPTPAAAASEWDCAASTSRSTFRRSKYTGQSRDAHSTPPPPTPNPPPPPFPLPPPPHPTPPPPPPQLTHTAARRCALCSRCAARHASTATAMAGVAAHPSHTTTVDGVSSPHTAQCRDRKKASIVIPFPIPCRRVHAGFRNVWSSSRGLSEVSGHGPGVRCWGPTFQGFRVPEIAGVKILRDQERFRGGLGSRFGDGQGAGFKVHGRARLRGQGPRVQGS
jgi:hypothetical protein